MSEAKQAQEQGISSELEKAGIAAETSDPPRDDCFRYKVVPATEGRVTTREEYLKLSQEDREEADRKERKWQQEMDTKDSDIGLWGTSRIRSLAGSWNCRWCKGGKSSGFPEMHWTRSATFDILHRNAVERSMGRLRRRSA